MRHQCKQHENLAQVPEIKQNNSNLTNNNSLEPYSKEGTNYHQYGYQLSKNIMACESCGST